jgi:hypothetical protein
MFLALQIYHLMADKDVYKRERRESRVNSGRHCILAEKIN